VAARETTAKAVLVKFVVLDRIALQERASSIDDNQCDHMGNLLVMVCVVSGRPRSSISIFFFSRQTALSRLADFPNIRTSPFVPELMTELRG